MATLLQSRQHRGTALTCRDDAQVADALRLSAQHEAFFRRVDSLTSDVLEAYVEFKMWQSTLERDWSFDPSLFDSEIQIEVDRIATLWFETTKIVVGLVNSAEGFTGGRISKGSQLREQYAAMVALELMDNGPLPPAMQELCKQATANPDQFEPLDSAGL